VPIFELTAERLRELQATTFAAQGLRERGDLQRLLREQVGAIAPDVLVFCEEFGEWQDSRRRIDLLGVDKDANLVVIELKRTEDGGHMELQAIRYAAMVSQMTFEKVAEVFQSYLNNLGRSGDARQTLLDFLGWDEPDEERFAQDVRIVLASAEFSLELTSAVLWLNERDLDIRCVRMKPYTDGKRTFIDVQQVLPLPEASAYFVNIREKREEERQSRRKEQQWSGLWFVHVGMDSAQDEPFDAEGRAYSRHWQHCVAKGYVSAGGAPRYSEPLKKLPLDAHIVAYQRATGYVGYGIVTSRAVPNHEFRLADGKSLEESLNPFKPNGTRSKEQWEYAVRVNWKKVFPLSEAKTFKGVFANQNIVCKLMDAETLRFVRREFDIGELPLEMP
jgi:hypothetical protein